MQHIVAVTSLLRKQGIAFRGHSENAASENQGNFLEVMKRLKTFDPFLQNYQAPSHSTYLPPTLQNSMIKCCADHGKHTERDQEIQNVCSDGR